ncbi:hypothetical protein BVH03_20170 [Pseudomonas sp. PA15(2017)]|uniref:hypothetical protein n=1 Tax=Pseudomonas sp. PA15(2017) TaxID=1932111 RepID=UPI000964606C|nr:hypothetical protein [Pseudomonas sp. PA15(2017)]OLU24422.1 hypothetical protein BVH03_20170 [Pseudomonas sp. PA15(2017)]
MIAPNSASAISFRAGMVIDKQRFSMPEAKQRFQDRSDSPTNRPQVWHPERRDRPHQTAVNARN